MKYVYRALSIPVFLIAIFFLIIHWLISPDINVMKLGGVAFLILGL